MYTFVFLLVPIKKLYSLIVTADKSKVGSNFKLTWLNFASTGLSKIDYNGPSNLTVLRNDHPSSIICN